MNFQYIMNESLIGVAFCVDYIFSKAMSANERDFYGLIIIGIVCLILGFNVLIVLVDSCMSIQEIMQVIK